MSLLPRKDGGELAALVILAVKLGSDGSRPAPEDQPTTSPTLPYSIAQPQGTAAQVQAARAVNTLVLGHEEAALH